MGTESIKELKATLDESLKHLREYDSEDNTELPALDLLSNDEDESATPAEEELAGLELGDPTPEELD
jgi:hypothetical protein